MSDLYYIEVCSLYYNFDESSFDEWLLNSVKCFFCTCWDGHVAYILSFIDVLYHIDWFADIEPSLHL